MVDREPAENYVVALIDPLLIERPTAPPQAIALGLLVTGQLEAYERQRSELGVPPFGDLTSIPGGEPGLRLLAGLAQLTTGGDDGIAVFSNLASDDNIPRDLAAAAAILASVALRRASRPDLASEVLRTRVGSPGNGPLTEAFLHLQLGVALASAGNYVEAMSETARVLTLDTADQASASIWEVAGDNHSQFAWIARSEIPRHISRSWANVPQARMRLYLSEGLGRYLDDYFEAFFQNPYSRTYSLRPEDPIDRSLARALFRAEVIGDWHATIEMRKTYGRYRLLTGVGEASPTASLAILSLVQGHDDKGIERATEALLGVGPLDALRDAAAEAALRPWWPGEARALMKLVAGAATTFSTDTAAVTFERLIAGERDLTQEVQGAGWVTTEYFRAVGAVARRAHAVARDELSSWVRRVSERDPDPRIHQSLGPVLAAIRWEELGRGERTRWLRYVDDNLAADTDHAFVAREVALHLVHADSRSAASTVLRVYQETRAPHLLPLALGAKQLDPSVRRELLGSVVQEATALRDRAHRGEYSVGLLDIGRLLGRAIVGPLGRRFVDDFTGFVLDPTVPSSERVNAIEAVIPDFGALPRRSQQQLSHGIPSSTTSVPLLDDPVAIHVVNLKLRAIGGTISSSEATDALLQLAHGISPESRRAAIDVAPYLEPVVGGLLSSTVVEGLTYDADPHVRGAALYVLLVRLTDTDGTTMDRRFNRLLTVIQEPGEIAPTAGWRAVHARRSRGRPIPNAVNQLALLVGARHMSAVVRGEANAFGVDGIRA